MAIQNDNTLVTKGDLKNLYSNKILPYLGGNFALATNVSDYYSTDEKLVGLWINGKPLYQKTIVDTLPSVINTPKYVNVGASIDYIMIINAMLINNDGFLIPLPSINPVTDSEQTRVAAADNTFPGNPNTIQLRTANSNHVGKTIYTTVQYTKTTDSAGSAATIPGCYDLNRPDLWPANQEIFFGNGLYGYRATGNFTDTATNTRWYANVIPATANANIIGTGGSFHVMNNGNNQMLSAFTNPTGNAGNVLAYSGWFYNYTSSTIRFAVTTGDNITLDTNNTYDVWVTYTK